MTEQILRTVIPMAMLPEFSKRTRELARQMLELTADNEADVSECGTAALYVMAAYIALIEGNTLRGKIITGMSNRIAKLVQANHTEHES